MIYFASDIHLGGGDEPGFRAREKQFVAWLDSVSEDAEAIILVGDIFDFWFEYRRVVPKGFVRTLGKLAELTDRGIRIVFFAGNHDMWLRDYLWKECGVEIRLRPEVMTLGGQRIFVAHGDNMNIDGKPLLKFMNRVFRSSLLRWLFSWLVHPDWAMAFGHWWSNSSRRSHGEEEFTEAVTEPLIRYARDYEDENGPVDHFVFGHMHFPRDFREEGIHVVHLGGWEKFPSYGELDGTGRLMLKMLKK